MKTYVLTFSKEFPATHPKAGSPTFFIDKITCKEKLHTIRANAELWFNRIADIQNGNAELSLRYWSGKPYCSPQIEFGRLGKEDEIGIQRLQFIGNLMTPCVDHWCYPRSRDIAKNDGLCLDDWCDWFEHYDLTKDMAIIWLCHQRYNNLILNFWLWIDVTMMRAHRRFSSCAQTHNAPFSAVACSRGPLRFRRLPICSGVEVYAHRHHRRTSVGQALPPDLRPTRPSLYKLKSHVF